MSSELINQNKKKMWNDFITNSTRGHFLQSFEWGEVMSKSGWIPLRLAVKQNGGINAAASLYLKKIIPTPWSILYCPRGPVLDYNDPESLRRLSEEIKNIAAKHNVIFLQLVPNVTIDEKSVTENLNAQNFVKIDKQGIFRLTQPLWVYRIDLRNTEEDLLANMKRKTRYSVRVSNKKGVKVYRKNSIADFDTLYKLLKESSKRKKFPLRSYSYFRSIWDEMAPHGLANLFFAVYGKHILAAELVLSCGNICWDMYRAASTEYKNLRANYALQWHIIQWAKKEGYHWYDQRGVPSFNPPPEHSGYGVYKFKKGFGGLPFTFIGDYYYIYKPTLYSAWETGETLLNRSSKLLLKILSG
jgi:lipid II:glycine glycyltransferase (peptidoglycan interpeptide bridge formation enzyme)